MIFGIFKSKEEKEKQEELIWQQRKDASEREIKRRGEYRVQTEITQLYYGLPVAKKNGGPYR